MPKEKFWRKSYDPGVDDIDPKLWEKSYVDAVLPALKKFPDKAAFYYMGVKITFAELDLYSNRFAQMLIASGLKKGDAVGINLPNLPEYIISWLGTLKAGCVVSGVSPLMSGEEMVYQLKDLKAKGLVTLDAIFAGRLVKVADDLPNLKLVVAAQVGGFLPAWKRFMGKKMKKIPTGPVTPLAGKTVYRMEEVIKSSKFSSELPQVKITADDIAYIQYTGGTTGAPKGAMLTHRNSLSDLLLVMKWLDWKEGEGVALSGFPFFHIAGLFFNICCSYLGWTQILIPNPRDTDHICKEIAKYRPTALVNVPSLFQMLIANPKFATVDHSNLKNCISAASPFPEQTQKQLEKIIGAGKLLEVYGMTETSPLTVMNPSQGKKKLGHIGLPMINTDLKLVDPDTGQEVEQGKPGEICVKGPQVMIGYFEKPDETKFAIDKDGYMHTGDVAIQDAEGYLRIVDRTKDMIIVGGFKVFSKRVEELLTEHEAVDLIALIGEVNPDRPGSEIVKAYLTVKPDNKFGGDEAAIKKDLAEFAKKKLSPYEVPKEWEIRKELPMTAVGKVDKKKLRRPKE
ncbi:MAG: AMP-binding protein [Proteobacteria bacterium]|nr:AMP-binding protein [Pseudomonadota bacterium]